MAQIGTEGQAEAHSGKTEPSAEAVQVQGVRVEYSYETAQHVVPSDDPGANDLDARGTEIGAPE